MKKLPISTIAIIVTLLGSVCALAVDQEDAIGADKWDYQVTPYFWMAELKGDATLRGRTGSVDVDFSKIFDHLDIGFMGRVEAWKSKWGFFLDGLYMDLGADFATPQGLVSTDIDFKMTMLDFGIGHRLLETPLGKDNSQKLSFDLLGGGRYMNLDGEIDITTNGPLSDIISGRKFGRREEWVEPIVGGRLRWDIDNKLAAAVRFDFGGFDIGEGSNLTWNLVAGIDYKLKENMSLKAGYRIFDIDYDSGSGNREFGLDSQFRGPIFGLTWRF